jgi:hypothetical protein
MRLIVLLILKLCLPIKSELLIVLALQNAMGWRESSWENGNARPQNAFTQAAAVRGASTPGPPIALRSSRGVTLSKLSTTPVCFAE